MDTYQCLDAARPLAPNKSGQSVQNHGGLAIVYRDNIQFKKILLNLDVTTFEYLLVMSQHIILLSIYRPTSRSVNALFMDELTAVLERLALYRRQIVVCGDFNIHVDDLGNTYGTRLLQLLESFDCVQHVNLPTHTAGHILDLVITRTETQLHSLKVIIIIIISHL